MHNGADSPRAVSAPDPQGDLHDALARAEAILAQQRRMLAMLGKAPGQSAHAAELARLAIAQRQGGRDSMRLLNLSLAEIAARQAILDAATEHLHQAEETIALDATVHAMHRISTAIDVALGCSEEIVELAQDAAIAQAATESAAALRLIYHYTNELSDLASLRSMIEAPAHAGVDCSATLRDTIEGLAHVSRDANVSILLQAPAAPVHTATKATLLRRTLSYLLLTALASPQATRIACSVQAIGRRIEFRIADDGVGANLERRASAGTFSAMLGDASTASSDASGFAVARRLAHALGGAIELETKPGAGDTLTLRIPQSNAADTQVS